MSVRFGTHAEYQEREYRGYRWLWGGLPPVPKMTAERRALIQGAEQPRDSFFLFRGGLQPASPVQPVNRRIILGQEQPSHPPSFLSIGGVPVAIPVHAVPEITSRLLVLQELPGHPAPFLSLGGIATPLPANPVPAVTRLLLTMQELPSHPPSQLRHMAPPLAYEKRQIFIIA